MSPPNFHLRLLFSKANQMWHCTEEIGRYSTFFLQSQHSHRSEGGFSRTHTVSVVAHDGVSSLMVAVTRKRRCQNRVSCGFEPLGQMGRAQDYQRKVKGSKPDFKRITVNQTKIPRALVSFSPPYSTQVQSTVGPSLSHHPPP